MTALTKIQARQDEQAARDILDREQHKNMAYVRQYARDHAAEIEAEWNALDGRTTAQKVRDDLAAKRGSV